MAARATAANLPRGEGDRCDVVDRVGEGEEASLFSPFSPPPFLFLFDVFCDGLVAVLLFPSVGEPALLCCAAVAAAAIFS